MRARNSLAAFAVMLLTASCAAVQADTPAQRLVVAETSYQAVVVSLTEAADNGSLPRETFPAVAKAVLSARAALDTWQAIEQAPTITVAAEHAAETAATGALTLLQTFKR